MIEYVDENIYYKRKKVKGKRKYFAIFLIIIVLSFIYYKYVVLDNLNEYFLAQAQAVAIDSTNETILKSLKEYAYSDLVYIEKDANGNVSYMKTDSYKINYINKVVASKTKDVMQDKFEKGIKVPILAFSGIKIISGYGRKILYKNLYVTNVICGFNSKFQSVGINQTLHSIYINVRCDVNWGLPLSGKTISTTNNILISETVLVGKVPEVYLNGNLFS